MNQNFASTWLIKNACFQLSIVFLMLICGNWAFAQTQKDVARIRREVAAINKGAAKFVKTTQSVEDISLEGTEATYYSANKVVRKITAEMFGETFNATGEYYYADEKLIFAFVKRRQYDTQIGANPPPKVVRTEEQRYYFAGGELIRLLIGKKEVKSGDERYDELKAEVIDTSTKLKNAGEN